jgi:hypothetical protein
MIVGETVQIEINDSWDLLALFNIEFEEEDDCDIDSALLDVQGHIFCDFNDNGIQEPGELGMSYHPVFSSPVGISAFSYIDGHYFNSVSDLEDGTYELTTNAPDNWHISTDSLTYNILVNDDFEQRDSLDFGFAPDGVIHEVEPAFIDGVSRCNDTINYWLDIQNTGTTIPSGQIHLLLDDSLSYISADMAPDSIVGQNIYWSYTDLFYFDNEFIKVQVGTPDGLADTVLSTLDVTIDSAGIELFATSTELEQIITCAYDPNDKTPTPIGEGEYGNISPTTAFIDYLIRFQNTGTDTAFNVVIEDQLDEHLDWNSLEVLSTSDYMTLEMDADGKVSFNFNDIMLPDSNVNMAGSQGYIKYRIQLKEGLPIGTSIYNTAEIYFDLNPAIVTNTTVNTLWVDDAGLNDNAVDQTLKVYPNPFTESTTIMFTEDLQNYAIRVVDMLGNEVYANAQLNGNQLEIDGAHFTSGIYLLMLIDKDLNEVKTTTKLVVK